jgi:hypothetical protein
VTFFEWQLEKLQPIPQTSDADLDLTLGQKPSLQLGKRDVWLGRNACSKRIVVDGELRFGAAAGRPCSDLAGRPPTDQGLVDVRHADPKDGCNRICPCPSINRRNHTRTQVLRVGLAHRSLRADSTRTLNHKIGSARILPIPQIVKML